MASYKVTVLQSPRENMISQGSAKGAKNLGALFQNKKLKKQTKKCNMYTLIKSLFERTNKDTKYITETDGKN
jgi:hypothetical protein